MTTFSKESEFENAVIHELRQRGWGDALPVRLLAYPLEWGLGLIGQGDGLLAVARAAK